MGALAPKAIFDWSILQGCITKKSPNIPEHREEVCLLVVLGNSNIGSMAFLCVSKISISAVLLDFVSINLHFDAVNTFI